MAKMIAVTALSMLFTSLVMLHAFYKKQQFYTAIIYLTKSNTSLAAFYFQLFVIIGLIGNLLKKLFFGELRIVEIERLTERLWFTVTETCLAFTVFREEFNLKFMTLLIILLAFKAFHLLADERVDYIEQTPIVSWSYHIRLFSVLTFLTIADLLFLIHALDYSLTVGATSQLVFGFEYALLVTFSFNSLIKYIFHMNEMNESHWENKTNLILYTELVLCFIRVIVYISFLLIMVHVYILPLSAIRPLYYTINAFKKTLNDVIHSRRAIHNLNTLYPDVTEDQLATADNVCIICREEMLRSCKILPCKHIFHTVCLRSWFQRQQSCPTCRLNVLTVNTSDETSDTSNLRNNDRTTQQLTENDQTERNSFQVQSLQALASKSMDKSNENVLEENSNEVLPKITGSEQLNSRYTVKSLYSMKTVLDFSFLLLEKRLNDKQSGQNEQTNENKPHNPVNNLSEQKNICH